MRITPWKVVGKGNLLNPKRIEYEAKNSQGMSDWILCQRKPRLRIRQIIKAREKMVQYSFMDLWSD
jgi:hypothetical protein